MGHWLLWLEQFPWKGKGGNEIAIGKVLTTGNPDNSLNQAESRYRERLVTEGKYKFQGRMFQILN